MSALCFVACNGVGKFHLNSVVERVGLDLFYSLFFGADMCVVFGHAKVEAFHVVGSKRWSINRERVEHQTHIKFGVVAVNQPNCGINKAKTVLLVVLAQSYNFHNVAVGDESQVELFHLLGPEIAVASHHQQIARA